MKFSIIIPTHNGATYIRKALDSVKSQTFKDYELIVICDACEDNTAEIAASYGAKVLTVDYKNDGLTRDAGLDAATGDWILFMDDDDWWLHEFVLKQLAGKLRNEDILAFSFIFKGFNYCEPLSNGGGTYWPAVWNKCWKRSFIGDTRFPNVTPNSDAYFHAAMFGKKPKVVNWDMPLYYYNYMRPGSLSDKQRQEGGPDFRRIS